MNEKISKQRIVEVLYRDKIFFKSYIQDYLKRLLKDRLNIEDVFPYFISFINNNNLTLNNWLDFADKINLKFNKQGLRDYDFPESSVYTPPKHLLIYPKLRALMNNYQGIWKDFSILDKETYCHVNFMRVYPFIHNNELICNLILSTNLIKGFFPPVIFDNYKDDYYECIKLGDSLKLKEIIIKIMDEEREHLIDFYKKYYLFPENISIEEIIMQKNSF